MYGKDVNNFFNQALVVMNKGRLAERNKEIENCLKYYRTSTEMTSTILNTDKDPRLAKFALNMIRMCISFEKFDLSQKYLTICDQIQNFFKDKYIKSQIKICQGLLLQKQAKHESAVANFHEARKILGNLFNNQHAYESL